MVTRPPALVHAGWREAFPWLVQGTTTRGVGGDPFDLGLFSDGSPEAEVRFRWSRLLEDTGMLRAVHARQPHGRAVRRFGGNAADADAQPAGAEAGGPSGGPTPSGAPRPSDASGPSGVPTLVPPCDGHATDRPGVLLAVTTADCVPVFVVDPGRRVVAMIHAGWRGAAAGILEEGLDLMRSGFACDPAELRIHLGPAICGACYEVGPEVFRAFGLEGSGEPAPIDVRALLARRAEEGGVHPDHLTVSEHCTRCTGSGLFSHRGGDAHRQVGYLGVRP